RTVQNSGGQQLELKKSGYCTALAPSDWTLQAGADGQTAELSGGSGAGHVAWGIRGINQAMRPYYGDFYGDPETANRATLQMLLRSTILYTSPPQAAAQYFTAREFDAGREHGLVLYRVY